MSNISFKYSRCNDIINSFGEELLEKRYNTLLKEMKIFLESNNLSEYARVDKFILANAITDYFSDIKRLKDFHKIENTNSQKVIAYVSYWLLYRKPIQVFYEVSEPPKELFTINERFVLQYILNHLSERERKCHILERENKGLENFSAFLLYYLVYRIHDAQSIEMIIVAFFAGQIFEQIDEDISFQLPPF